jgi:hypothetical protein
MRIYENLVSTTGKFPLNLVFILQGPYGTLALNVGR